MSWKCENCGTENGDELKRCSCCHVPLQLQFGLAGPDKTLFLRSGERVGRTIYRRLVQDESRFADRDMFLVECDEDSGAWSLTATLGTTQAVLVNGTVCEPNVRVAIADNDRIELGSRTGSKRVAALTVRLDV